MSLNYPQCEMNMYPFASVGISFACFSTKSSKVSAHFAFSSSVFGVGYVASHMKLSLCAAKVLATYLRVMQYKDVDVDEIAESSARISSNNEW